jgi:hypothetical protein
MPATIMNVRSSFCAPVALAALAATTSLTLTACRDSGKESAARAAEHAASLTALADKDVGEVERGLPEGAKRIGVLLFPKGSTTKPDGPAVRSAITKARREILDLNLAKSTFFAVTDETGVAIRNNLEEDVMAGQNLITIFPEIGKATTAGYVTTTGAFPGPPGKNGPDKDWVAAIPIKKDDGTPGGLFVTGWSYRYFARHLSEVLRNDLLEQAKKDGNPGKIAIHYVAMFDKSGVYSAPLTPDVNEKAMTGLDLVGKTSAGPAQGAVTITDRVFGYAAVRLPKIAPETGVVVLRSEP